MLEGEIIRFYRKKAGLTQEQLGEGICTTTHVSKIERGKTPYSSDIINLFSERLGICLQQEMDALQNIESRLRQWHTSIIRQRKKEIEEQKRVLEDIPFIQDSKHAAHYQLLRARYHLFNLDDKRANQIIKQLQRDFPSLSPYEHNLLLHVKGIYYIGNKLNNPEHQQKPFYYLKQVNMDIYGNKEYYYHLAVAYHMIGSKVMAYFYGDKALQHFKETNNYFRSINAESVMLLQISGDDCFDFQKLVERYEDLIYDCDLLGLDDKKGLLLNNLGTEYFNMGDYAKSLECLKQALPLADKSSYIHLQRLLNYVDAGLNGKLLRKAILLKRIKEGISLSKRLNSELYLTLFLLLKVQAEEQIEEYFRLIENKALPLFITSRHVSLIKRYGKLLYEYFVETNQHYKALETSKLLVKF
ncbi:helix-turn-helix domain-containing protein [Virgibacillus siamensis]|uniref:helix-turn-helix domain-containing protein n=1 Tax=Virgibacillus siamensis TaxID=480071 RepID=UPI0009852BF9|nr:helix-turn-helix domain-containing protein [Virgibacillus siamensis]